MQASKFAMFSTLRSRAFSPFFTLHQLHFDHRLFDWKQHKIQIVRDHPQLRLLRPQNLNTLMTTDNISIIQFNEQELIHEAMQLNVAPFHQTPFLYDVFDTECFVLTDQEHYNHLWKLQQQWKPKILQDRWTTLMLK